MPYLLHKICGVKLYDEIELFMLMDFNDITLRIAGKTFDDYIANDSEALPFSDEQKRALFLDSAGTPLLRGHKRKRASE